MSDLNTTVLAVAAFLAALATIWKFLVQPARKLAKRTSHFLDDWFGEEARPGRAAIPAMPDRITHLEQNYAALVSQQTFLAGQVKEWLEESTSDRQALHKRLDSVTTALEDTTEALLDESIEE